MSLKTKLVSTISAICMVLALLTVGVWAVSTASVTLGGSVSFTADNIHARVTGSVTGTQETINLAELNYSADSAPTTELDSWTNNQMTFTSGNLITMTITVENLSEERSLFVTLTDNTTTDNVGKTLKQGANAYTSGSVVEVTAGNTTTFTMTLSVTDTNKSASATVSYQVDLRDANAPEPIALLHDTENDYYYVEMGEYNEAPVRWRVVGVNGNHYTYNETQAPTGELSFILETKTTSCEFGALYYNDETGNMRGNEDYSTSVVRQYITGHDCALLYTFEGYEDYQVNKNYLNDINIDSTLDNVYKQIKTRSISDLYKNEVMNPTTTEGADKLWIPSVSEVYSLVGGGDISIIPNSWAQEIQNKTAWSTDYWTRSPDSGSLFNVNKSGNGVGSIACDGIVAVRPMFLLEV